MDQADIVIQSVRPLIMPEVEVEISNGKKYLANLGQFSVVNCFSKNQDEWEKVSITTHGFNLTWTSRFEVHLDQIIDRATSQEDIKLQA